jgi:PPP family 3-phenylpropionic acid transporter
MHRTPLALFWLLFMGGLGAIFPFFSLYFRENGGLSGTQVGAVVGVLPLVGLLAQPLWGRLADRTGSRSRILALVSCAAGLTYLLVPMARGFVPILLAMALVASFSTAVMPLATSVSLATLGAAGTRDFGRVRVWGTVGFLLVVVALPPLLHLLQAGRPPGPLQEAASEPRLGAIFVVAATCWIAASAVALVLPRHGAMALRASPGDWLRLVRHRPFRRILLFTLAAYLCFQGPMILFPIYVRSIGGDLDTVSRLWIPMLLLEIPLIAYSGAGITRLGARGLLALGVLAAAVRWTLCGLTTDTRVIFPVQLLHGVVVAGLIVGAPLYVEETVPEELRSTSQGLLAMMGVGVGGITSNLIAGWLLDSVGPAAPYLAGGIGGFALCAMLPAILPRAARPTEETTPT